MIREIRVDRRGFSKYLRGIWRAFQVSKPGEQPYAIIVDEVSDFVTKLKKDIPLYHRVRDVAAPDRSGGEIVPLSLCPKATGSGRCDKCRLVRHGGETRFNRHNIRELDFPARIKTDADGKPLRTPHNPLKVDLDRIGRTEEIRVGDTLFASSITSWYGKPIDEKTRRSTPISLFRKDPETERTPAESPLEIMKSYLKFAHLPILSREFEVDADGGKMWDAELARGIEEAPKTWDEGVTFPLDACEVPHVRFTDLLPLEQLRRHGETEGVGVLFVGATVLEDDRKILTSVWPDLVTQEHPYPERRIKQVALVYPDGYHGFGGPIDHSENLQQLITKPLEDHGKGIIFCPTKKRAEGVYKAVFRDHPTARLGVENDEVLQSHKTLHEEAECKVWVTYSRGVLGLGANIPGLRFLVVDAHSFRARASFTPGEVTPEEFERLRAEERTALLFQNLGRALRGEKDKTVVLIVLNADWELREALANSDAITQGSELPHIVAPTKDVGLKTLVAQAHQWLANGGGDWPETQPLPETTKGRKPKKTREDVLAAAEVAIKAGETWRTFYARHQPHRQLTEGEIQALKLRFGR